MYIKKASAKLFIFFFDYVSRKPKELKRSQTNMCIKLQKIFFLKMNSSKLTILSNFTDSQDLFEQLLNIVTLFVIQCREN